MKKEQIFKVMKDYAVPAGIILFAVLYQVMILGRHALHIDEALYSFWALKVAAGQDILLHKTYTDKFPILSYIIAVFMKIWGGNDVVARIPNIIVTAVIILAVYRAAVGFGLFAAAAAACFTVFNSYFISFGPSVFVDPLMVLFVFLSAIKISEKKYKTAGIFMGIAVMAKITALFFFLPAAAYLFIIERKRIKTAFAGIWKGFWPLFLFLFLWAGLVQLHSFRLFYNNIPGGGEGKPPLEVMSTLGSSLLYFIGAAQIIIFWTYAFVCARTKKVCGERDLIVMLYGGSFFIFLWLVAAAGGTIYDRYLLVLVPFFAVISAAALKKAAGIFRGQKTKKAVNAAAIFVSVLICVSVFLKEPGSGAFYGANDSFRETASMIPDDPNGVVLGYGVNYWLMQYYYFEKGEVFSFKLSPEGLLDSCRILNEKAEKNFYAVTSENFEPGNLREICDLEKDFEIAGNAGKDPVVYVIR
ncbi:MAG: ArnT family glycosyltransferase [Candidatus Goldiibacteriota bacterium]